METATLRIENQSPAIFGYELEALTFDDAAACEGRRLIASAGQLPRGVAHSVRIAAGGPFTLLLRASGGGASRGESCMLAGTFTPAGGENYVALFRAPERSCDLLVVRRETSPAGGRRYVAEASYRERRDPACAGGASAPSSIPAPAGAPPPPREPAAPPAPRLPPR